ncbi:MAG TPA: glutamate-cysteine ligase family protein [Rhodocyclaceae bacterium]|nr:glutamate-cysteine ligase family protein [Rhodocyclaceae bacterium]
MKNSTELAASAAGAGTLTIGISVQVQTLDRTSLRPAAIGADLIGAIADGPYSEALLARRDSAVIEIVSPRFATIDELRHNLQAIRRYLSMLAGAFDVVIVGGGCHPAAAGEAAAAGQLFGLHLRLGCPDAVLADYLCTAWQRYLPQLIALSAASPFHAGSDTECASYRARTLEDLDPDRHARIGRDAADGIEIRVCDAPLNLDTAVDLAAYTQALSAYLLAEVPAADDAAIFEPRLARLQAARFGLDGLLGTHDDGQTIGQDILATIDRLRRSAYPSENGNAFDRIEEQVLACGNDATTMRSYLRSDRAMATMLTHLAQTWASARHDGRPG